MILPIKNAGIFIVTLAFSEQLYCNFYTLFRGADVDGVLLVFLCHKKVLRFSISRNGGLRVRLQKGAEN